MTEQLKVLIEQATVAQLRAFATLHMGLEVPGNATRAKILALLEPVWNKPEILLQAEPEPTEQDKAGKQVAPAAKARTYVTVVIQRMEGAGGNDPVQLGCNGKVMLVKRGVPQAIPIEFFESLKNAIANHYDPSEDGLGINPIPREVPLYPYQVLPNAAAA